MNGRDQSGLLTLYYYSFVIRNSTKDFPEEHEKALLGTVISIGRILGSICHDHPLHPDAIQFAQEGKAYYEVRNRCHTKSWKRA